MAILCTSAFSWFAALGEEKRLWELCRRKSVPCRAHKSQMKQEAEKLVFKVSYYG